MISFNLALIPALAINVALFWLFDASTNVQSLPRSSSMLILFTAAVISLNALLEYLLKPRLLFMPLLAFSLLWAVIVLWHRFGWVGATVSGGLIAVIGVMVLVRAGKRSIQD